MDDELVAEQIAYYRARAPWYDDWWFRRGQYAGRGVDAHATEVRALLADLDEWLETVRPDDVLEIAAGTGELTRRIAPRVRRMTVLDAAPETLEINRGKLGHDVGHVEYVVVDVFAWQPTRVFDAAVFGFWLSHVPRERWDSFWSTVRAAVRPGGRVWFVDSAPPPEAQNERFVRGDGVVDQETDVHVRELPDGRAFRSVKRFHDPAYLERDLARMGFDAVIRTTGWGNFIGRASRRVDGAA